jgi:DNA polymerase-3 subunit beta
MNVSCEKSLLESILNKTQRAVLAKSTIPALEGILLEAYRHTLQASGYNLEIGIRCSIQANVTQEGAVIINSKIFGDIVRKLPNDEVYISVDDKMIVTIKCGMSEFNIVAFPAEDFPALPDVIPDNRIQIQKNRLKSIIRQTLFAVSTTENNTVHTGSKFNFDGACLTVVSVDGYRLALRKEKIQGQRPISIVIPGKALNEISKITDDSEDFVDIMIGRKHIMIEADNVIFISRLIDGEFLNYDNAIPKGNKIIARVNVKAMMDGVERVGLIISDKFKSPIRLEYHYDVLKMSCATQLGRVSELIPITLNGEAIEIGFNHKYLLDALKACETEEIFMELNSPLTPCVIKPIEGDDFLFLVLPVRFKNESAE